MSSSHLIDRSRIYLLFRVGCNRRLGVCCPLTIPGLCRFMIRVSRYCTDQQKQDWATHILHGSTPPKIYTHLSIHTFAEIKMPPSERPQQTSVKQDKDRAESSARPTSAPVNLWRGARHSASSVTAPMNQARGDRHSTTAVKTAADASTKRSLRSSQVDPTAKPSTLPASQERGVRYPAAIVTINADQGRFHSI